MGDRWGSAGPPEEAYSRVTRDLAVVYAGLPAALDAHLQRLVTDYDATLREAAPDELPRGPVEQPPLDGRAVAVVPADPRCLGLWLVLTDAPTLWGWTAGPSWFGLPQCSCDACDTDLEELLRELDQVTVGATGGMSRQVSGLRRVRVADRGPSWASTSWFDRSEARALGLRRGRWDWPPWPRRS